MTATVTKPRSRLCGSCGLIHPCNDALSLCACPAGCTGDMLTIMLDPWTEARRRAFPEALAPMELDR